MQREIERVAGKSTAELVNAVQMSAADRQAAMAALQRGEAIADALYRATESVQAAVTVLLRGARVVAQRVRRTLAGPARS
jgi:hypothetical protein